MSVNSIIVGPPRSGTSMTAVMFKKCGYFVTEDEDTQLQQANEFNPCGFWEAEAIKKANVEIFHAAGFEFDNTWMFDAITDQQVENIRSLQPLDSHRKLIDEFDEHAPWLWKDPCLCFTLSYWWPLLKQHKTGVILMKRDPQEVYQSFLRLKWTELNGDDREAAFQRIEHHMKIAENTIKQLDIPHIVVNYSDYADKAEETATRIGAFFGLDLNGEDIGYDKNLRTSGYRGRLYRLLDYISGCIPDSARKRIKKTIPDFVWKIIFPLRHMK